jgi:phenylacetic acid degradation operon negative regulatory protein
MLIFSLVGTTEMSIAALQRGPAPKANSLMITVFGDSVAPRGAPMWLGGLIRMVAPLGLSDRLVRTAVNRLTNDNWLARETAGRRAFYGLSEAGHERFESATARIYAPDTQSWNGQWCLVVTSAATLESTRREVLKRDLAWQGFGAVAPGVFAHPLPDLDALGQVLDEHGIRDQTAIFRADPHEIMSDESPALADLVGRGWDLRSLEQSYTALVDRFTPMLDQADKLDPRHAFVTRSLLIHEYRRAILRDPLLPDALLPKDWPGTAARALCRALYRRIWQTAETHVETNLETADGSLPEASASFFRRFGGLDQKS